MIHGVTPPEHKPGTEPSHDPDWWRGAVIYQIYPRSYQDHNGDGIGDLVGISERLDYVADLGVDGIWLSPFFTSPMKDFGYDVSNYRDVDPIFGSLNDFDALLEKAHNLGLKVIIDQVISHTSSQHAWFEESRQSRTNGRADWYVWADAQADGTPPNNWLSIFGGSAWTWDPRRQQYYMHNFLASQPDLNFHNVKVQDAVLDEMRFWLERGVDGFRLDTVNFYFCSKGLESNPPIEPDEYNDSIAPDVNPYNLQDHIYDKSQPENVAFLKRLRELMNEYPGSTTVGEIGDAQRQLEVMSEYTSGSDKLHMAYTFDFLGGDFNAQYFRAHVQPTSAKLTGGWPCMAFSNHDVMRHVSRWAMHGQEEQIGRLAAQILLTLRGSICLYQGEELGLTEADIAYEELVDPYGIEFWPNYKGRDGCRTPMVWQAAAHLGGFTTAARSWLPVPADHLNRAVDLQELNPESMLSFYRAMIDFRKEHAALIKGDLEFVDVPEGIFAFTRSFEDEKLLCVFNMSDEPLRFKLPADLHVSQLEMPGTLAQSQRGVISLEAFSAYMGAVSE